MALRVGVILLKAKQVDPDGFDQWVVAELPFGLETARRLMAITKAYGTLPGDRLAQLPKPWQALYALKAVPQDRLAQAIADGEIGPQTTVAEAKRFARVVRGNRPWQLRDENRTMRADRTAGALMHYSPTDLSAEAAAMLRRWLDAAVPPADRID